MKKKDLLNKLDLQCFIAFDFETTGLDALNDRIIELAAVKFENGEITDRFVTLVNPKINIPHLITEITGITDAMVAKKPSPKAEDPRDLAAIDYARKNMGDCKLKTDKDYVVPEDQRVNAEKKRRQMVLLEESIHAIKMGYNQRYLALRELKRRIVENVTLWIELE